MAKPKFKIRPTYKARCAACGWESIDYITRKGARLDAALMHNEWDCTDRQDDRKQAAEAMRQDMFGGADD